MIIKAIFACAISLLILTQCYAAGGYSTTSTSTTQDATTTTILKSVSATASTAADTSTITATDQDGNSVTVDLDADEVSGLTEDWLEDAGYDADKNTVKVEVDDDGAITKFSVYDENSNLVCSYDADTHLMTYYYTTGDLTGKANYVTSESDRAYTWRYSGYDRTDPGTGTDGHVITQYYNYDSDGTLTSVEYFTWTAGNSPRSGDAATYSRYMYRVDTYDSDGTTISDTEYYDDPRPTYWDPTLTGTVVQDSSGRYFLETDDGTKYLLTAAKDGFDADGDGTSGADEMSEVDWASYVGEEITVRGQQIADANDNESDIYFDGESAQGFEVVDVIESDEELIDGWEDISETIDSVWESMNSTFTTIEDETDVDVVYAKLYAVLADALDEKGITSSNITEYADEGLTAAWKAHNYSSVSTLSDKALEYFYASSVDWTMVLAFATEILTRYKDEADSQMADLTSYPDDEDANAELNAVGAANWMIANYYANTGNEEKEKEYLNTVIDNYGYSYMLDDDDETWLKISDKAQDLLDELD